MCQQTLEDSTHNVLRKDDIIFFILFVCEITVCLSVCRLVQNICGENAESVLSRLDKQKKKKEG